jgi:hypothetical protein
MGKNGTLLQWRFPRNPGEFLDRCSVREFVMRELNGHDEKDIGAWMDLAIAANPAIATDALKLMQLERKESMRRALVSVDGEPVDQSHGVPYAPLDGWTKRTMQFLGNAFNALNGVEPDEMGKFLAVVAAKKESQPTTAVNQKATAGV